MSNNAINHRPPPTTINKITANTANTDLGVRDVLITVCASGGDLTLKFGESGLSAAGADDWPLADGEKETFWLGGTTRTHVSIQGTGALLWYPG